MFKNPLRKYQQGGTAPTQEQQKLLAAFIEWLPKRVKEFQGMAPEAIAQALDGMSKTSEGQKQVQQLMQQFQQEMQGGQPAFRNGGKIHDFICKHAKGGSVDCGCGGIKVQKGQDGLQKVGRGLRTVMRTTPIGKYLLAPEKNEGYRDAEWGSHRLPDLEGIIRRRGGVGQDINGNPVYYLGEVVNGTSADSYYFPNKNIIEQRIAGEPDQIIRTYQPGSDEFKAVYNRFQPLIPSNQPGGKIAKAQKGVRVNKKTKTVTQVGEGLSEYDAKEMGINPNTIVPTSSIIVAYPNTKPYLVNDQVPFYKRNGIVFTTGGIESPFKEGNVTVTSVGDQNGFNVGTWDQQHEAKTFPLIMRRTTPKDTTYNMGWHWYNKKDVGYPEIRALYNAAIDASDTFGLDAGSHQELQRQKLERKQNK